MAASRKCERSGIGVNLEHWSLVMTSRSIVFAEPVRTAIGTFGGSLKDVPAAALGALCSVSPADFNTNIGAYHVVYFTTVVRQTPKGLL